jgi:hypothetical protein
MDPIGLVDALARATHRWVRRLGPPADPEDRAHMAFVCGVITGICTELYPDENSQRWVAYVYALLEGRGSDALRRAMAIMSCAGEQELAPQYARGLAHSATVVAWFLSPSAGS